MNHETLYSVTMAVRGCSSRQLALLMDAVGAGRVRSTDKPHNLDLGDTDQRTNGERHDSVDRERLKHSRTDCADRVLPGQPTNRGCNT